MILTRYLMRSYVMRFAALLVGLVFFLQTLDLMSQATEVLNGGGPPIASLMRYVGLRMPALVETVAPLAGLLGALTALVTMARNSEILAMRAAGRSVMSLVSGLVVIGAMLSVMLFLFSNYVVTRANAVLEDWKAADYRPDGQVRNEEPSWMMDGNTMIQIGHVMRDGTVLNDLRLFRQRPAGGIVDVITIRLAVWEDDQWSTFEVKRVGGDDAAPAATPEGQKPEDHQSTAAQATTQPDPGSDGANAVISGAASGGQDTAAPSGAEDITPIWHTDLRPENFLRYANHPSALSIKALSEYVGPEAVGSRPGYFYDTWLHQKIAGPIILAIMPLLGAMAAFSHHRQGTAVLTLIWGVSLGFLFVVIDNVLLAMGQFGSLPPLMAAWLPLVFFTTVGIWIVFRFEHTGAHT
ncbi:MAG: LptF/LptG family permease [Rhodospirillaceae bacterium]|nr:MAG: LptF/LptG family permease [Rhodospirillaceae bacterium]